jgi:hypothetical protein
MNSLLKEPLTRLHLACFLFGGVLGLFAGPQLLLQYACHYTDSRTGADIIGECGWVSELRARDAPGESEIFVQNPEVPANIGSLRILTSTTSTSTSLAATTSSTAHSVVCPVCADCVCPVCFDVNATLKELKALRPDVENAAAQFGWQRMRTKCMGLIDASRDYHYVLAPGLHPVNPPTNFNDSFYCFRKDDGGFWLNRTPDRTGQILWSWDSSQCLNSALRVYKAG